MNPELKAKWVAALRSGEYKQTKRYLRDCNGYCCIGVLAELHMPDIWTSSCVVESSPGRRGILFAEYSFADDVGLVGLIDPLTDMNDSGASFAEIADYIESQAAI